MAYNPILSAAISIGSAIKKELWDFVQGNFADHEVRINSLEASTPKIPVIKFYVLNASSFSTATGLFYWESNDNFTITSAYFQIFEKGSLSGTFEIDIKKSTTNLDGPSFSTIFSTKPSILYSTASDYSKSTNQVLDAAKINIGVGNYLRFDITQTPASGVMSKFLITVYGE
ncbi:MAG: hypothetical protein HUM72_12650 [Dolichospermum sp.]|nr:hypothetical protein [Dolichospermum sp.]